VLDALLEQESWGFRELLVRSGGNESVYGVFLSILELVKSRQVDASQAETGGEIRIRLRADRDPTRLAGLFADPEPQPVLDTEPEPQPGPRVADEALADSGADSIV
jgi:chromatin segregation and condensation protein Rec8/ScpA/Scc1 (kleisin family)